MTTSNSATRLRTSTNSLRPNLLSSKAAKSRMSSRSPATLRGALGRCTLMATLSPPRSTALWTCPMLAEPSGTGSKEANNSSTGAPSSPSIISWATPAGMGLAVSWSFWSSESTPSGSMSERVERTCPNLTKVGPRSSSVRRNLTPKLGAKNSCRPFFSLLSRLTSKTKPKPWSTRTRLIWEKRLRFPDRAAWEIPPFATQVLLLQSRRRLGGVAAFGRGLRFACRRRRRRGTVLEHPHPVLQLLDAEEKILVVLPGRKPAPPETLLHGSVDQRSRPGRALAGAVHHVVDHRAALFALDAALLDEGVHDLLHPVPRRGSSAYLQQDQTLQRLAYGPTHNYLPIIWCNTYMITKAQPVWPRR